MQPSAESHATTLRSLLHFIARDLGIDDAGKQKHAIALTREIRLEILRIRLRLKQHEGPFGDIHCSECGSTKASVTRDAELMWEAQGFPVPEPFCCEVSERGLLVDSAVLAQYHPVIASIMAAEEEE